MPRYSYANDPADYYQGTGFDPYTGRLNGGALVMQVLNQIAGLKKQKQEEGWQMEDREWQAKQRAFAEQQAARQAEEDAYNKSQRVPWQVKAFLSGITAGKEHENRLAEIAAQGEQTRKTAATKPPKSDADRLYEWQAHVTRTADILENDLNRLNQEYLSYVKAQNESDPEDAMMQASLNKSLMANQIKQRKAKQILSRLALLKAGDQIPADLQKEIDAYINPPEPPAPTSPFAGVKASAGRVSTKKSKAEESLPAGFTIVQ